MFVVDTPEARAKRRARSAVQRAVKSGKLKKLTACIQCGGPGRRIEAHHPNGYGPGHELDVLWLCSTCHQRFHKTRCVFVRCDKAPWCKENDVCWWLQES